MSEPFPYSFPSTVTPSSTIFLALSHAPPALDWNIAIKTPVTVTPARSPPSISGPPTPNNLSPNPTITGVKIAKTPGKTICLIEASVEIATHF